MSQTAKQKVLRRTSVLVPALLAALTSFAAEPTAAPDFTAVWKLDGDATELRPSDGSPLPLTAAGKKSYDKNKALRVKGDFSFDLAMNRCASPGAVRMMTLPYAIEFVQRPYQLTLLFEWNHLYRLINLRERPRVAPYPLAIGTSNGHWEGDTLVVETTDFTDNTQLDSSGLPHSDQLRLTERIRRIGADRLEDTMTIHDPKVFSRDWTTTLSYRATGAAGIAEDVCLDRLESGHPAIVLPQAAPK